MLKKISQHKFISSFFILIIAFSGYYGYKKFGVNPAATRYVLAAVEKGAIISTVTGSGQVSPLNQVDVKSKASGDVFYVNVKNGAAVTTGAIIAQLDSKDAARAVRDAEINLANAKLSLEKLKLDKSENNLNNDF